MPFSEFACRAGGSNLNSGSRNGSSTEPGTAADFTYASGNWVASTGVFTPASGDPVADGVAVGDFASVYPDGSSVTPFIGRVTARTTTTITVSLTAKAGTAPTDGTGDRTLKIGGAWQGPNGASGFPFGVIQNTLTNAAADHPRINFKNDATYSVTAAMTHGNAGPTQWEGYTTSYGDGGRAIIDGGTSGASYVVLTVTNADNTFENWEWKNNGATGSSQWFNTSGASVAREVFRRVVTRDVRGMGIMVGGTYSEFDECEFYGCNQSNTANTGGLQVFGNSAMIRRCFFHDNSGSNSSGYVFNTSTLIAFENCVFDTNGAHGINMSTQGGILVVDGCEFYSNTGNGILLANSIALSAYIENSNFVKNGAYGINGTGAGGRLGKIRNCGFGSGTQANTSGTVNGPKGIVESDSVTYASDVTPWVDPVDGDFRINLAAAQGTGRGVFVQTQSGYGDPNPTIGYPDIGAAQHEDAGGGGGGGAIVFAGSGRFGVRES